MMDCERNSQKGFCSGYFVYAEYQECDFLSALGKSLNLYSGVKFFWDHVDLKVQA